jgi:cytochrome P450
MAQESTKASDVTLDDESWDPFELFDRAMGADTCRDPYPDYAAMRRRAPIERVDLAKLMGEMVKSLGTNLPEVYVASSYAAVSEVLRDGKRFSSAGYKATIGLVMGPTILVMDEPEHGRYRGLVQTAFRTKALKKWEHELVGPIIDGYIDGFAGRGRADLVRELTFPFPVYVIAGLLGLSKEDLPRFHRWAVGLISVGFDFANGLAASKKLGEYLTPIIESRRANPQEDIISVLTQAELEGTRLDNEHILGFLRLLLPAGAETTYRSSSNLIFGLLTHPEQLDAVRRDRSLIPRAMEEGLRWETPLTGIGRVCTEDTEVCGVRIPKGVMVQVSLGAANRDETRWDRPDDFDIFRPPKQHMAFAFGPHRCLGMDLARMETEVLLNALFDRLPNLRLDPAADDVHITGRIFRAPRRLPVRFG